MKYFVKYRLIGNELVEDICLPYNRNIERTFEADDDAWKDAKNYLPDITKRLVEFKLDLRFLFKKIKLFLTYMFFLI